MNNTVDIDKIREMISSPAAYTQKIPLSINSYNEVIELWLKYKKNSNMHIDDVTVRNVFDFHKTNTHHVVMYYSFGQSDSLLMCRVGMNYINILVDARPTDQLGYSYIATFC